MKLNRGIIVPLILVATMLLLPVALSAGVSPNTLIAPLGNDAGHGSYYGGQIYNFSSIVVGVNDYGVLGVIAGGVSAGFQYPPGNDYESLAVGWWGDGWSIFYNVGGTEYSGGFSPDDDAWGVVAGGTVSPTYHDTWASTTIVTSDSRVAITIETRIYPEYKGVVQIITIKNIGSEVLENVEFKRITDWDVWRPLIGSFDNYWGLDENRLPGYYLAVAFVNTSIAPGTAYMGIAVSPTPDAVDLDWDDYYDRGILSPVITYLDEDGNTDLYFDGAVVYDWLLGDLSPGEEATIAAFLAAGDTLEELEDNIVALGNTTTLSLGPRIVGGELAAPTSTGHGTWAAAAVVVGLAALALLARKR